MHDRIVNVRDVFDIQELLFDKASCQGSVSGVPMRGRAGVGGDAVCRRPPVQDDRAMLRLASWLL